MLLLERLLITPNRKLATSSKRRLLNQDQNLTPEKMLSTPNEKLTTPSKRRLLNQDPMLTPEKWNTPNKKQIRTSKLKGCITPGPLQWPVSEPARTKRRRIGDYQLSTRKRLKLDDNDNENIG